MSKLRNPVIPDYTPKKKEQPEVKLDLKPCLVCKKRTAYYLNWKWQLFKKYFNKWVNSLD